MFAEHLQHHIHLTGANEASKAMVTACVAFAVFLRSVHATWLLTATHACASDDVIELTMPTDI